MATGFGFWSLRWFNPVMEVDLCGHATLAAAWALFQKDHEIDRLVFSTRSGPLTVTCQPNALAMDFPAIKYWKVIADDRLSDAFAQIPDEQFGSAMETMVVFPDLTTTAQ